MSLLICCDRVSGFCSTVRLVYLSIATTRQPATDLGFLLVKHPDRLHEFDLSFGKATVFFPEASNDRCEAVLVLDVDPVGLVRGRGSGSGLLSQYVNDRPYAASSFLSVAMNRVFRSAMAGTSRDKPELVDVAIPLEISVTPLPVRKSDVFVHSLFEPLGWTVTTTRLDGYSGPSRYISLELAGTMRLVDALSHLYVLVPALDADKHYWVDEAEVEKLIERAGAWLGAHPMREDIASRYLRRQRKLTRQALARLVPEEESEGRTAAERKLDPEDALEAPLNLHELRLDAVAELLASAGAKTVADLGCGEGKLLQRLCSDRRLDKIIGLDVSMRALEYAAERLKLGHPDGPADGRVVLLHGALTYFDERWREADAVALVEVIEHLDADRLPALEEIMFGRARPKTVVLTTPNREYNVLFANLSAGGYRHPDHRFEWSRQELKSWTAKIEAQYGYKPEIVDLGPKHAEHGAPSQMAVFTR